MTEYKRATELCKGCVVMMNSRSGMAGYGNAQCVAEVDLHLGEVSLWGHNQWYKTYYEGSETSMYDFTVAQIEQYTALANARHIPWASSDD